MALKSKDVTINFKAKTDFKSAGKGFDNVNKKVKKAEKQVKKSANNMSKSFANVGKAIGAAFALNALKNFAAASIRLFDVQAKAEVKLLTALKGKEGIQKRLIKQAQDLQNVTLFGDEATINAQAFLAAMGLSESAVSSLIPLVQDLATKTGMDLASAADLVAKSVGSSTNALSRYGITIEGAVGSSERLNSAIIGLNKQVGGQAKAAALVGTGALTQLANRFSDLQEVLGKALVSVVNFFIPIKSGSELLKEEKKSLDRVIPRVTAYAVGSKERSVIINKLILDYPKLLKNINAETISNEALNTALKKVNDNLLDRIILQKETEKVEKAVTEQDEIRIKATITTANALKFANASNKLYSSGLEKVNDSGQGTLEFVRSYIADLILLQEQQLREAEASGKQELRVKSLVFSLSSLQSKFELLGELREEDLVAGDKVLDLTKKREEKARQLGLSTGEQISNEEDLNKLRVETIGDLQKQIATEKSSIKSQDAIREGKKKIAVINLNINKIQERLNFLLGKESEANKKIREEREEAEKEEISRNNDIASRDEKAIFDRILLLKDAELKRIGLQEESLQKIQDFADKEVEIEVEKLRQITENEDITDEERLLAITEFNLRKKEIEADSDDRKKDLDEVAEAERILFEKEKLAFDKMLAEEREKVQRRLTNNIIGFANALITATGAGADAQAALLVFEKTVAIASIITDTIKGNIKLTGQLGIAAPPLILANNIASAIGIGTIVATAIPQFKGLNQTTQKRLSKGEIDIQGAGTGTSDSISAMLSKGESVMTADETSTYKLALKSMQNNDFDSYVMNKYLPSLIQGNSKGDLATNMLRSIMIQNVAELNDTKIVKALKNNKNVNILNSDFIKQGIKEAFEDNAFKSHNSWD